MGNNKEENKKLKIQRLGEERLNNQGCLMKIIEYNNAHNIIVEFKDGYKTNARYGDFVNGGIKNPYYPSVYGAGAIGNKYPIFMNGKHIKEYMIWKGVIKRCCDNKYKISHPAYVNAICCKEWLLFENFYDWLHSQENFDKWYNGDKWCIDKDILVKGNKIYSSETCCLVPININNLFTKRNTFRGELPIGVFKRNNKFLACCSNPFKDNKTNHTKHLGSYDTIKEAFEVYKKHKESLIKQIAQEEYNKGNITKQCYDAMMKYEVEITD